MIDINKYRCRNCKHWHSSPFDGNWHKCLVNIGRQACDCNNFESNDNLVYLEQQYEKSLK